MVLLQNIIIAVANVADVLLNVYSWLIIARAIISWVSPDPYNPIVNFLYMVTEPILRPARRLIPPIGGTIDISPIVVLILLMFLRQALVKTLIDIARNLS